MDIHIQDLSFQEAQENLDYEERLLKEAHNTSITLRFWEAKYDFVVLGRSNKAKTEVNIEECKKNHVPILKRCSGGGTILQSPGVLNYAIIAPIKGGLTSIRKSNHLIMSAIVKELNQIQSGFALQGDSDITFLSKKCCGNAQKRSQDHFLFHGCFILKEVDIKKISLYLKHPSKEPDYRKQRSHDAFLCHCPLTQRQIKKAIQNSIHQLQFHLNK